LSAIKSKINTLIANIILSLQFDQSFKIPEICKVNNNLLNMIYRNCLTPGYLENTLIIFRAEDHDNYQPYKITNSELRIFVLYLNSRTFPFSVDCLNL
jgi:hypothetical protein